ncbi:MAG: hypothetical protein SH857_12115 [Chitinophagales bacterium]|mgnify:CR=1 FL=1|nr:hypothetical protein [Chitinophagales bacterium]
MSAKYDFYTPYQYAGNKPIRYIDLDGAEEFGRVEYSYNGIMFFNQTGALLNSRKAIDANGQSIKTGVIVNQINLNQATLATFSPATLSNNNPEVMIGNNTLKTNWISFQFNAGIITPASANDPNYGTLGFDSTIAQNMRATPWADSDLAGASRTTQSIFFPMNTQANFPTA